MPYMFYKGLSALQSKRGAVFICLVLRVCVLEQHAVIFVSTARRLFSRRAPASEEFDAVLFVTAKFE